MSRGFVMFKIYNELFNHLFCIQSIYGSGRYYNYENVMNIAYLWISN